MRKIKIKRENVDNACRTEKTSEAHYLSGILQCKQAAFTLHSVAVPTSLWQPWWCHDFSGIVMSYVNYTCHIFTLFSYNKKEIKLIIINGIYNSAIYFSFIIV